MKKHIINKSFRQLFSFVFIIFSLFFISSLSAQNKKQLEIKRKKLQSEIKKINYVLSKTKKSEKNVLSQLDDINKKIDVHKEIITTIQQESNVFKLEIDKNKKQIDSIERAVSTLKKEYAETVVKSYKNKSKNSRLLFLLSSESFLQAYKRLQYMNQFADYRKHQAEEILIKKQKLLVLNDSILIKKQIKDSLVSIQIKERKVVDLEKNKKQKILDKVKKKERKYVAQIRKKQRQEQAYERKLENLIANVIKKSNKKAGKKTTSSKKFYLTKEAKKLASSFTKNKGKLPAPVEKGYVSRYFGQRRHEVNRKITIKNSGWFYTSPKNSKARAVFKGTIKAILVDPKTKIKTILIQHGNYMTVYGNLEKLLVKNGDNVSTKQKLGTIHTDKTTDKTILKFQLWKDAKAQNPSSWMYK